MGDIILCVCADCPNKKRCRYSIELADISTFPAIYVVADMSSICHWYKETQESDTNEMSKMRL